MPSLPQCQRLTGYQELPWPARTRGNGTFAYLAVPGHRP
jgi:hypothetical protein